MAYTEFPWSTIRRRLKERVELKPYWTDDECLVAFNEALRVWQWLTGYWRSRITLPTVANQYEYVLPSTMTYRTRMTFNSLPLAGSSRVDLNQGRWNWRNETTASGNDVPTRPMVWAPIDLYLFYLWPADAAGGNTLTVDGVTQTPVLVEDGDTVDLGEELLTTLLGYSLHVLSFKKGGSTFHATLPLYQTFLAEAAEENDQLKTSAMFRRIRGLDWRDMKPLQGTPTLLDPIVGKAG